MTEEQITLAAREICAEQAQKQDNDDGTRYLVGYYDHTVWMRLVEQGIRKGMKMSKPKPDPLVEVLNDLEWSNTDALAGDLRAALDARGLEIRPKEQ